MMTACVCVYVAPRMESRVLDRLCWSLSLTDILSVLMMSRVM